MAKKKRFRFKKSIRRTFYLLLTATVVIFAIRYFTGRSHAYGIRMPEGYKVHGIDVSRWQGPMDWKSLERIRSGKDSIRIAFAFIKATEGRSLLDPQFKTHWRDAGKTNIVRGAYHYFIPTRDAKEQADNFIKNVKLEKGDLPPVLDIEVLGKRGAQQLRQDLKVWLDAVEKHYGMKPIIYTYIDFYEKYLKDGELEKYPLWIAHYYKKTLNVSEKWLFWQHSDSGEIPGINEKVDFNVFSGNLEQLKKLCK